MPSVYNQQVVVLDVKIITSQFKGIRDPKILHFSSHET